MLTIPAGSWAGGSDDEPGNVFAEKEGSTWYRTYLPVSRLSGTTRQGDNIISLPPIRTGNLHT